MAGTVSSPDMEQGAAAFRADFDRAVELMLEWPDGGEPSAEWLAIPAVVRHAVTTHYAFEDICNGGLEQYFFNHTGNLAHETLAGYRALGLTHMAELLERAIALFPGGYLRSCRARRRVLGDPPVLSETLAKQWDEIDSEMFKALPSADQNDWSIAVNSAAMKYVQT